MDYDLRLVPALPGLTNIPAGGLPADPGARYQLSFGVGSSGPDMVDVIVEDDGTVTCGGGLTAIVEDGIIVGFDKGAAPVSVEKVPLEPGQWVRVQFSGWVPREGALPDATVYLRVEMEPILKSLAETLGLSHATNLSITADPLSRALTESAEAAGFHLTSGA